MDNSLTSAFTLAGFLLAQVTLVLSGEPGGSDLMPVAFVTDQQGQRYEFFEGETLEAMVASAGTELPKRGYSAWTYAYEGFLTSGGERQNAFVVHAWVKGMDEPIALAHAWKRSTPDGPVVLVGAPVLMPLSNSLKPGKREHFQASVLGEEQLAAIKAGMERNRQINAR